ncbi:MAG TPA: 5-(carboxyamino)imidazole ribonucleotide synthase [Gemmatimonadaceae bacterium]|nr:5-(carboxyamino)imidazole ribonucleotide synthase [Gemmatimonadaceae bacterium]
MTPILPGATIGFFGGGQLGRMAAMAARSMGYDVHVLDPDPDCPARPLASRCVTAALDDAVAADDFARGCNVITLEIERVGAESIAAASRHCPVRPNANAVYVVQDRARQKEWLESNGFPVAPFRIVRSADECEAAVAALGASIAKTCVGGYDGRGQARIESAANAAGAWRALHADRLVVEQRVDIDFEISVLVARRPEGETLVYSPALNHHDHGVLTWSAWPASLPATLGVEAEALGQRVAEALDVVGLLAVEMFVLRDGRLLVNELAPRPHNTYHESERGAATSQFEQIVRAVCDLPLGAVDAVSPAAIINLLGDVWTHGVPNFERALEVPTVRLHLYGKRHARPGRKMGHLSAVGLTTDEALGRVIDAYERLSARD